MGSPLLAVFQNVRTPGAFRALGGVTVWWRVHLYGPQGQVVGRRELTHEADLRHPDRDRITYPGGNVYGRLGASVFVLRHGMPWPSLTEAAGEELELLGLLLRAPWAFADTGRFGVLEPQFVERNGESLARIRIERLRPDSGVQGPPVEQMTTHDRFELLCDPTTRFPRELAYRVGASGAERRVVLEDFRELAGGVRIPYRRVFVDASGRRTMEFEILRFEAGQAMSEQLFRP